MGWESFDVGRFDLCPPPPFRVKPGQPNLKVLITRLFLALEECDNNILIWSDFTLCSSFKINRWLFGFGEFSFWWIQFASVLLCARSTFNSDFLISHIYNNMYIHIPLKINFKVFLLISHIYKTCIIFLLHPEIRK